MANSVLGGIFFIKDAWNFWKILVFGKNSSTVVFFTFNILNAPIYGVFNLSSVKFFVDKSVLSPGLIVTWFFSVSNFFLTFCLALFILIPIVAQLFFIFAANVDAVWLTVNQFRLFSISCRTMPHVGIVSNFRCMIC